MRILVANPHLVRLNAFGACEQDRLKNAQTFLHLGHEVRAFTFSTPAQPIEAVTQVYADRGLPVTVVPITHARLEPARLTDLAYLDGAAWQYAQSKYLSAFEDTLAEFQPDLIWCHGSYHWAPARLARSHGLRTVIRSVNYEPEQLRHEHDASLANTIRYFGKVQSERRALQSANVMAAITPDELGIYERVDPATCVQLLPLATLPELLREPTVRDLRPLHSCFMGATYNVPHNRRALD
ncbi:MAG: glycosyltransferase, partial [Anaerolineae bacterium]|nr:glycosyltransferase [Anaerolineae bacterium]